VNSGKLQKRPQQHAALLREAQRSAADPQTGRLRCLSCGSVFVSYIALAAHLQKHGGVNAVDYRQAKMVGSSYGVFSRQPVHRPDVKLSDMLTSKSQTRKMKREDDRSHGTDVKEIPEKSADGKGRKKNKMTPTKRTILIHQVLSLKQKLTMLQHELDVVNLRLSNCQGSIACAKMKKQMKTLRGQINASTTELQMALTAINQKFTFRQLVMIEYLTNQMQWLSEIHSRETSINHPIIDDVHESEMLSGSDSVMKLYSELETMEREMEAVRDAEWTAESMRLVETRRDPESGKIFIMRPSFADSSSGITTQLAQEPEAVVEDAPVEPVSCDNEQNVGEDGMYFSSQETSSDDDMWGFSDVLTEWAKQTRHLAQTQPIRQLEPKQDITPEPKIETEKQMSVNQSLAANKDAPTGGIQVMHVKKKAETSNSQRTEILTEPLEWGDDEDQQLPQCIFIKPHLAVACDKDLSKSPTKDNKTSRMKPSPQPVAEGQTPINAGNSQSHSDDCLDNAVFNLLSQLNAIQHAHMKSDNTDSKLRWIVSGFSEVKKHLLRGSVKLIILANHLDASVDSMIADTRTKAADKGVPVVTALTRKKIGQIYHFRKRMSIVAVLDYQDSEDAFESVIRLAHSADD